MKSFQSLRVMLVLTGFLMLFTSVSYGAKFQSDEYFQPDDYYMPYFPEMSGRTLVMVRKYELGGRSYLRPVVDSLGVANDAEVDAASFVDDYYYLVGVQNDSNHLLRLGFEIFNAKTNSYGKPSYLFVNQSKLSSYTFEKVFPLPAIKRGHKIRVEVEHTTLLQLLVNSTDPEVQDALTTFVLVKDPNDPLSPGVIGSYADINVVLLDVVLLVE